MERILSLYSRHRHSCSPEFSTFLSREDLKVYRSTLEDTGRRCVASNNCPSTGEEMVILLPSNVRSCATPFSPMVFGCHRRSTPARESFLKSLVSLRVGHRLLNSVLINGAHAIIFMSGHILPLVRGVAGVNEMNIGISFSFYRRSVPRRGFRRVRSAITSLHLSTVISATFEVSERGSRSLVGTGNILLGRTRAFSVSGGVSRNSDFSVENFNGTYLSRVNKRSGGSEVFVAVGGCV